jgi:hypothetical protein
MTIKTDQVNSENMNVKAQLDAQKKYRVRLRHEVGAKDRGKENTLTVGVNGHFHFIKRGEFVDVPEEVYLILVRAGEIEPQSPEHDHEVPKNRLVASHVEG